MREPGRRDRWVEAIQEAPTLAAAKRVTQAEFALDDGRPMDAVQSLAALQQGGARHIHSLRLSLKAAEQAGDWSKVLHLTRQLAKRDAIHPTAARGLQVRSIRALCSAISQADEAEKLYSQLPAEEQQEPEVVEAVVSAMTRAQATKPAWKLIEETMQQRWSASLARRFLELEGLSARDKLMRAERWLERYPDEFELHLLLGELCAQESLWGKAEAFFKKAAMHPPTAAEAHLRWAMLNERLRRPAQAADHFRRSALLSAGLSDTAPAVDFETGAGDELGLVGSEEQRRLSDIARLGQAAQGD
jgi:HemY protein